MDFRTLPGSHISSRNAWHSDSVVQPGQCPTLRQLHFVGRPDPFGPQCATVISFPLIISPLCINLPNLTLRYAYKYFQCNSSPWTTVTGQETPQKTKKAKASKTAATSATPTKLNEILKCCFKFLSSDEMFYKNIWNWSELIDVVGAATLDDVGRVLYNKILRITLGMNDAQLKHLNCTVSDEVLLRVDSELSAKLPTSRSQRLAHHIHTSPGFSEWLSKHNAAVDIEGAFLHVFNADSARYWNGTLSNFSTPGALIKVDSTQRNLQNVALGIGSGKPVCLSGPVGSGKTSLIEYLAARTGRLQPKTTVKQETIAKPCENGSGKKRKGKRDSEPEFRLADPTANTTSGFLRIQLGHETDSKMLLGQYCCTDIPGEFVWQPGVLTQAVVNGYWLLLEDLDCATQDVCTVLTSLLENGYLNVPGFKDSIRIEPGFQLFFTIRLVELKTLLNHSPINSTLF